MNSIIFLFLFYIIDLLTSYLYDLVPFSISGVFPLPSEKVSAQMYRMAVEILTKCYGYEHYEVSNYAKPGKRSRHNQNYWRNEPFWGIGMGAASFVSCQLTSRLLRRGLSFVYSYDLYTINLFIQIDGVRFTRPATYNEYTEWVKSLPVSTENTTQANHNNIEDHKEMGMDSILDVVMLSLRTADGLNLTTLPVEIRRRVIDSLLPYTSPPQQETSSLEIPLVQFFSEDNDLVALPLLEEKALRVRLTDPDGFLLSNDIISSVFAALMP